MGGYDGKGMDWSVFSASPSMFNIDHPEGGPPQQQPPAPAHPHPLQQSLSQPQSQSSQSTVGQISPRHPPTHGPHPPHGSQQQHPHHLHHQQHQQQQISGLPPSSGGLRGDGGSVADNTPSHGSRSSSAGGVLGMSAGGSRAGSVSSGGTPPLGGRSAAPWNMMAPPLRSDGGARAAASGSPSAGLSMASALQNMKRLSITSDDSNSGVSCWFFFFLFFFRHCGQQTRSLFVVLFQSALTSLAFFVFCFRRGGRGG